MRFLSLAVLAAVCCLCVASCPVAAQTWALCPEAPTDITVNAMKLSLVNRNISIVMAATSDEEITTGAVVTIAVNLGGAQIFTEDIDLAQGTQLPIAANSNFTYSYGVDIPSIAPAGAYTVDLTFLDQDSTPLTCIAINFNLSEKKDQEVAADLKQADVADVKKTQPRPLFAEY